MSLEVALNKGSVSFASIFFNLAYNPPLINSMLLDSIPFSFVLIFLNIVSWVSTISVLIPDSLFNLLDWVSLGAKIANSAVGSSSILYNSFAITTVFPTPAPPKIKDILYNVSFFFICSGILLSIVLSLSSKTLNFDGWSAFATATLTANSCPNKGAYEKLGSSTIPFNLA